MTTTSPPPSDSSSGQLEALLQQLKRQFAHGGHSSSQNRPPDAAAAALGRALGEAFWPSLPPLPLPGTGSSPPTASSSTTNQKNPSQRSTSSWFQNSAQAAAASTSPRNSSSLLLKIPRGILPGLCQPQLHPSIPHAFFEVLVQYYMRYSRSLLILDHHDDLVGSQAAHHKNQRQEEDTHQDQEEDQEEAIWMDQLAWLGSWLLHLDEVWREEGDDNVEGGSPSSTPGSSDHAVVESWLACARTYAVLIWTRTLHATVRTQAWTSRPPPRRRPARHDYWLETYRRLPWTWSRMTLAREMVAAGALFWTALTDDDDDDANQAQSRSGEVGRRRRTILMTSMESVWSSLWSAVLFSNSHLEKRSWFQHCSHFTWTFVLGRMGSPSPNSLEESSSSSEVTVEEALSLNRWFTQGLQLLLWVEGTNSAFRKNAARVAILNHNLEVLDLAETWFLELIAWGHALLGCLTEGADKEQEEDFTVLRHQLMQEWIGATLLRQVLPEFLGLRHAHPPSHGPFGSSTVLDALLELIRAATMGPDGTPAIYPPPNMDTVTVLRLSARILSTPSTQERLALFRVLAATQPLEKTAMVLLHAMSCILMHDPACAATALELQRLLDLRPKKPTHQFASARGLTWRTAMATNLLTDPSIQDYQDLLDHVVAINDFSSTDFTPMQQMGALLATVALLDDDVRSSYTLLKALLSRYTHLAITIMPLFMKRLETASVARDGQQLVQELEFICEALVIDAHAAQEFWTLLAEQGLQPHAPSSLRIMVLRLLPKLCVGNRRLYRRIVDTLGGTLTNKEPESRLAVAASLADLAELDCIRDVSDVIGWIQDLLTEELSSPISSLIVHYAIRCLHYLVISGALDFNVVIKVFNKKLCSVADVEALLKLPLVVLEALTLLLGDGECEPVDEDDVVHKGEPTTAVLSPQVTTAIGALIAIGQSLHSQYQTKTDLAEKRLYIRARINVFDSLSNYSADALGITDEAIKGLLVSEETENSRPGPVGKQYVALRLLVITGLEDPSILKREKNCRSLHKVCNMVLSKEEQVLGASFWQKRGRRRKEAQLGKEQGFVSHSLLKALPDAESVSAVALQTLEPAKAITILLSSDGSQLSVLRDNADATLEDTDPFYLVFAVQAFLHFARGLVNANSSSIGPIIQEIREWYDIFVSPDAMLLLLSGICLFLPLEQQVDIDTRSFINETFEKIVEAFRNQVFAEDDVAKICLGLNGVAAAREGNIDRVSEIVEMLEQSVRGYGGEQKFGAFYGLAMIAQTMPHLLREETSNERTLFFKGIVQRVCVFMIEELATCYEDSGEILLTLIACLKTGKATSDLVQMVESLGSNSVALLMTKHVIAMYLFLSCALCFPSLGAVDGELLESVFRLLEAFEWGAGKGIALAPVIRTCRSLGLLSMEELDLIHAEYTSVFERRMDSDEADIDSDGLDDIFFAVSGMFWKPTSHSVKSLLVGNKELFDDDGCALSIIATVVSAASIPCLGGESFLRAPRLQSEVSSSEVESIVKLVNDAIAAKDQRKYSTIAVILFGLLSSMNSPSLYIDILEAKPRESDQMDDDNEELLDFSKLQVPLAATLLSDTIGILERLTSDAKKKMGEKDELVLSHSLQCLESISLPGNFAALVIAPLLKTTLNIKKGCISLLCAQLRGRRSVLHEGSEFVKLSIQLALSENAEWSRSLGQLAGPNTFVAQLGGVAPKLPTESFERILLSIWSKCIGSGQDSMSIMTESFLRSLKQMISSSALSPKASNAVRRLVVSRVQSDLALQDVDVLVTKRSDSGSVLDVYTSCLREIPTNSLEEMGFFASRESSQDSFLVESVTNLAILQLVRTGYFGSKKREGQELARIMSWMSGRIASLPDSRNHPILKRVMLAFAASTDKEGSQAKNERLSTLFEALLMAKTEGAKLQFALLAAVVAHWWDSKASDSDLSLGFFCGVDAESSVSLPYSALDQYFSMVINDFPYNLASFSSEQKITPVVSNQLLRLHSRWSEIGVDQDYISILSRAILSCHTPGNADDAYVHLACSLLTPEFK